LKIEVNKTVFDEVKDLRKSFLQENKIQFVHDKCHYYGWADYYLFEIDGLKKGYGCVWGGNKRQDRDTIFEFYLEAPYRKFSSTIFRSLQALSKARFVECQTNNDLLSKLVFEVAKNINAEAILFEDYYQSGLDLKGIVFKRSVRENNNPDDSGEYVLELDGEEIASGGFMMNYNFPYADIYMEVKEKFRSKGYCSLIVQELKKLVYAIGRVPSARCNIKNQASKSCLQKAGFRPCGFLLNGEISSD
jgi:RimJ/RimL family protein N-acetyltransferase